MGDSSEVSQKLGDKGAIEITAKIMVVAIIVLFLVVVFAFFLHLHAKWFVQRRQGDSNAASARRRRRLDFAEDLAAVTRLRLGLDPSVLKSIPVSIFNPKDFPDGLECAVCLCEVSEDEKVRTLPKCDHGFHVDCIDMWFQSHSTCPLCRNPISLPTSTADSESTMENSLQSPPLGENSAAAAVSGYSSESPNFPTNVLFWEDETQVSTLSGPCLEEGHVNSSQQTPVSSSSSSWASTGSRPDGMLAIDIPRQINEEQEAKSPMTTRMRSLKRLWSRDRRGSPRSPSNNDLEQGGRGQT